LIALSLVGCGISYNISTNGDPNAKDAAGLASFICIILYIIVFELSLGPLCWIYQTEIMTDKGLSIGVAINLILTVAASLLAPTLFDKFDGWNFIVCSIFSLLCAFFCLFMMKETKGLSEKEIAQLYSSVPLDADLLEQRDEE